MKFLTNKYKNLPFFDDFTFYYNMDTKEIKRTINESERTPTSLIIDEVISDKTTGGVSNIKHKYIQDKDSKTYLFFVSKPFIIALLALCLFINLQYDFATVLKLEKAITLITFVISSIILGLIIVGFIHILLIVYKNQKPNLKFIDNFKFIQYFGYASMLFIFFFFNFALDTKSTYIFTCVVSIGTFSFYSYMFYIYMFLPLKLIKEKKLKFYRNSNDNKIILVEIKE